MGVPISQMWTVASYVLKQKLLRRKRYPLVLMLEPLFRCNLACAGCGKIQYPAHILKRDMSLEDALKAVDECGAPMVSIPGGEPLLYPHITELVEELVKRRKYIYLCTNAQQQSHNSGVPFRSSTNQRSFAEHIWKLQVGCKHLRI